MRNETTQSLSFRNLARLIIVQEGEIQQTGSPFWGGQYTLKTAELAAIKLLLTGVDDSNIVSTEHVTQDRAEQVELLDELLADIDAARLAASELSDVGEDKDELEDQLDRLNSSIEAQKESLDAAQGELDTLLVFVFGQPATAVEPSNVARSWSSARRPRTASTRSPTSSSASTCCSSTIMSIETA